MTTLQRRSRLAAVCLSAAALLGALAACSSDKASTAMTTARGATTTTLLDPSGATSTVPLTTSTLVATTTLTDTNANSIADCVTYIPIGAVLADKEATNLWDIVGRDVTKLDDLCTKFLSTSPGTIASLSLKLVAYAQSQTTVPGDPAATIANAGTGATVAAPTTVAAAAMPNLLCTNLGDAERLVQSLISKPPSTFDTSGSRRTQDVAAQWIVVSQVPDVGSPLTGPPQLGVVKVAEPSVCSAANSGG
jgi:hypothetical protein